MKDTSTEKLFAILRERFEMGGPISNAALTELEERWFSGRTRVNEDSRILARLARVEEDLAAFKRAHDEHTHHNGNRGYTGAPVIGHAEGTRMYEAKPKAPWLPYEGHPRADGPTIEKMRAEAENRAWATIEKWCKAQEFEHEVRLPIKSEQCAMLWRKTLTSSVCIIDKAGTSRLDALAHLAAWCDEQLHETVPKACTCGGGPIHAADCAGAGGP